MISIVHDLTGKSGACRSRQPLCKKEGSLRNQGEIPKSTATTRVLGSAVVGTAGSLNGRLAVGDTGLEAGAGKESYAAGPRLGSRRNCSRLDVLVRNIFIFAIKRFDLDDGYWKTKGDND
jgi:hypothetical protein